MTIWICGNSHAGALRRAITGEELAARDMQIFALGSGRYEAASFSALRAGRVVVTPKEYIERMEHYTGGRQFGRDHLWGFLLGTHSAALYRRPYWRRAEPGAIAEAGKQPVSEALLDAVIASRQKPTRDFIISLREAGVPIFIIECPYPRPDHPAVANGTRLETIAHIDRRHRDAFKAFLKEQQVDLVACPRDTHEDGFLRRRYWKEADEDGKPDPHHGNAEYGGLMLEEIMRYLRERHPERIPAAT